MIYVGDVVSINKSIKITMTHNLLKGKRGIIFGALNEESIAWKVAVKAAEEGATIALSNTAMALRMGTLDKLAEQINAPIIAADATSVEDLERYSQRLRRNSVAKSTSCSTL